MATTEERLAKIRALCANWRACGYIDRSLARFVLGDVEWLLAGLDAATARLSAADALQAAVIEAILMLGAADVAYDAARLAATTPQD